MKIMNKYVEELVTEMLFDFNDLALGNSYKDVGYESKKEFFQEMSKKMDELYTRLLKEKENA
jgi:ABC-type transporter MlaC component